MAKKKEKEKEKKKMGRPAINIDKQTFEKLCALQCTEEEIADFFNCSVYTISEWTKKTYKDENGNALTFQEVYKIKRQMGKVSLRRHQFKLAEKSSSMAIFLGKQYLGQTDYTENTNIEKIIVSNDVPSDDIEETEE